MKRTPFVAAWTLVGALVAFTVFAGIVAIWLESDRLGYTCAVTGTAGLFGAIGMGAATDFNGVPARNLPRAARRQLRDEQDRIRLAAEIARMEREAGLS